MKTIKQLADAYGMTKQAIHYHVKKLPKECINFDDKNGKNVLMINQKGQELLCSWLVKEPSNESSKFLILELQQKIAMLELEKELQNKSTTEKIEILQAELDKRDEQIKSLLSLIDQEQKLHVITQQKVMMLEQKAEPDKRRFWFRKSTKSNENQQKPTDTNEFY